MRSSFLLFVDQMARRIGASLPVDTAEDGVADERLDSPKHKGTKGSNEGFWSELTSRLSVLAGLMVVQSASSVILSRFEALLRDHMVVMMFLTMVRSSSPRFALA